MFRANSTGRAATLALAAFLAALPAAASTRPAPAPAPVAPADPTKPPPDNTMDLWKEVLASSAIYSLPSHDEPGYRLEIMVERLRDRGAYGIARLTYRFSEIDAEAEEPTPVWKLSRRAPLTAKAPRYIVSGPNGVWWTDGPVEGAKLERLVHRLPDFGKGKLSGRTHVEERQLARGTVKCFSLAARSMPPEICLAPKRGIVAAKGLMGNGYQKVLFIQPGWIEAH